MAGAGCVPAEAAPTLPAMAHKPIDWTQLWYPGPKRAFTADEMARAGSDAPSRTLLVITAVNVATAVLMLAQVAPPGQTARLTAALVALVALGAVAARWLWWRPWRRPLMQVQLAVLAVLVLVMLGIRWRVPERTEREALALVLALGCALLVTLLWFLVTWRAGQIESRLREQAEREQAIEMARRLSAAQLEPHFLFNTLASLQHWVDTGDARAAPLLAALTGYLRATLPMFKRPLMTLGDELLAVERYLQVMQARLGSRLRWQIKVEEPVRRALLPPGLVLTLVENAVLHGAEPQLRGAEVQVRGRVQAGRVELEVIDSGPGATTPLREGAGLGNLRQRLQLGCGDDARLDLGPAPGGGFRAQLQLPLKLNAP
jgi:hypothetical protein